MRKEEEEAGRRTGAGTKRGECGRRGKDERGTNEEEGRRRRKKPEEGGRKWKKGDEGRMSSESVEIRRNLTCYGWLCQPATENTNTWYQIYCTHGCDSRKPINIRRGSG